MVKKFRINDLIAIVADGGTLRTGIDVYDSNGILMLDRDFIVKNTSTLEMLKANGIHSISLGIGKKSGIWDIHGNPLAVDGSGTVNSGKEKARSSTGLSSHGSIEKRLYEIEELKILAAQKYDTAKTSIKKILGDIKKTGGQFDFNEVEKNVSDLVEFLTVMDNPFSYLTKEIFSYDDYLYNHSINVCAIGTAVANKFNSNLSSIISQHLTDDIRQAGNPAGKSTGRENTIFRCYHKDEYHDICTGFFLHDIGKVMVPDKVLNKKGRLTKEEFDLVKKHSYDLGVRILEKNNLKNPFIKQIVQYHHAALYDGEDRCYPDNRPPGEIPLYVKICKLADIYDAMTSKRCYKEAFNPINVVTDIFRRYAKKDRMLQHILHAFVKSIGIYPPGSIIFLKNGQMVYVLESKGPIVLPFTDTDGRTLSEKPNAIDLGDPDAGEGCCTDNTRSIKTPLKVYDRLPSFLQSAISKSGHS